MMQRRQPDKTGKRRWAIPVILLLAVVLVIVIISAIRGLNKPTESSAVRLPCLASQNVTPFGENILYYDGVSIFCITTSGSVRWNYQVGSDASFSVGGNSVVAWSGSQIYILDQNGNPSYSDNLGQQVQMARIGKRYAAAVIGDDTEPRLLIRDLNGAPVDEEADAFSGRVMLDVGFYGEDGQYIWTLSLDVFGTVANTVLNTFEVGQMNTAAISLGEAITYKVLFDAQKLRVMTTMQLRTFNYQGREETKEAILVYGWNLIASETPEKGDIMMLLAPSTQTNSQYSIREIRLLSGTVDRRYTLPSSCVGAAIYNKTVYAFSSDYIYRTDLGAQRFSALNRPQGMEAPTELLGMTSNGRALLACGDTVYAVTMP
jgi:hypothetical protein